jgi:iron(III) transport system ATP-binding protein
MSDAPGPGDDRVRARATGTFVAVSEPLSIERVSKSFGDSTVLSDVSLHVAPGSVCALLGPSGSGKTTLLRIIAGLESADQGTITLGERTLVDTGKKVSVAAERRALGMVFQDWAVFPHLSVAGNVSFGLQPHRGTDHSARVAEILAMVGLGGFEARMPGTLSGGQLQRVALARALAPRPAALLLDEPFSNLDVALRVRVRTELSQLLRDAGVTAVFVTHDQQEAFVLADRVAVMRDGRIAQVGTPLEIYQRPVDAWTASFVGDANLVPGMAAEGVAETPLGTIPLTDRALAGQCLVLQRPENLDVAVGDRGTVALIEFQGHDVVVFVDLDDGIRLRVRCRATELRVGDRVAVRAGSQPAMGYPA